MRWIPFIASLSVIFLLGADSSSETHNPRYRIAAIPFANCSKHGAYQRHLFKGLTNLRSLGDCKTLLLKSYLSLTDSTAYYQSDGQWKSVLPSGERLPVKQTPSSPRPRKRQISLNLKITERSLSLLRQS